MGTRPKVTRKEFKEDRIYLTLTNVADFFTRYRLWIGLGALAVLLAFAASYYRSISSRRSSAEASWALYQTNYVESHSERTAALKKMAEEYRGTPPARFASFEMANILYDNGAVVASNLDGGSSATMYYQGKVVNRPCDLLGERSIPSAFVVK